MYASLGIITTMRGWGLKDLLFLVKKREVVVRLPSTKAIRINSCCNSVDDKGTCIGCVKYFIKEKKKEISFLRANLDVIYVGFNLQRSNEREGFKLIISLVCVIYIYIHVFKKKKIPQKVRGVHGLGVDLKFGPC